MYLFPQLFYALTRQRMKHYIIETQKKKDINLSFLYLIWNKTLSSNNLGMLFLSHMVLHRYPQLLHVPDVLHKRQYPLPFPM